MIVGPKGEDRCIPEGVLYDGALQEKGVMPRKAPWLYPRDTMPSRFTLASWRRVATKRAKSLGAPFACGICKRPLHSYGRLMLKHPMSHGKSRQRKICRICADLLITLLDVLEWYGAADNLPAELWHDPRLQDPQGYPLDKRDG